MEFTGLFHKEILSGRRPALNYFGAVRPDLRLENKTPGSLSQVFDRTIKVYILNPENEVIPVFRRKKRFSILTNGPLPLIKRERLTF